MSLAAEAEMRSERENGVTITDGEREAALFDGPGEARALCRAIEWEATPLGPVSRWSSELCIAVQMVLDSGLPHIILWGRELIQIYNDSYARLIQGKHPLALGRGNLEIWPEVAHINGPIFDRVFAGETVTLEDAPYPLQRAGSVEEVYLTISYSPIRDMGGSIRGVLCAMIETTRNVEFRALQTVQEELYAQLEVERGRLATIFERAPALIATLRGPEHVFEMVNPPYYQLVGHRDILGRAVREALPEVVSQGFIELLDAVYRTGEPFRGEEVALRLQREPGAPLEERFVNFVYQPLPDAGGAVGGILAHGVDVTELVSARRRAEEQARKLESQAQELKRQATELRSARAEVEVANASLVARAEESERSRRAVEEAQAIATAFFEAAPIPAALVGPDLRYQLINQALASFYGLSSQAVEGKTIAEVVPRYADRVEPYYRRVLETGEPVQNLEMIIPRRDSPEEYRHLVINYFPVRVPEGEVIGVGMIGLDVSERHNVEQAQREHTALVETLQRVGRSVASELDLETVVQEVTDAATTLTGAQFGAFFYNVVDDAGESFTLYAIAGVDREEFSRFPMPRATPVFAPTFHGEGNVRSDDITRDPRYGHWAPYHGMPEGHLPVTSYLAVPVISRTGEVLGGLFFGHQKPGVFKDRDERLAEGIAGWAAVAMDNARLYQAERIARAEAEHANRVKGDFLATMSHELRTPLNAMIGYTDLLLAGIPERISEGAEAKVQRIGVSARHLLELIEEILTFSRLEAGEERTDMHLIRPEVLLTEVQALMEPLALAKGIRFDCRAPQNPARMVSDPRKLRQILINLVGNAIKFTEEGWIRLTLEQVGGEALFAIEDTGCGIAPEHAERIFEPFWQVQAGMTRTAGGTGLGLSVTRRLARLLGGDVTVSSAAGQGAVFTVRLPMQPPTPLDLGAGDRLTG